MSKAVLHMVCGKAAAGKSTLCGVLAGQAGTVVVSEDAWLSGLFGDQATLADYVTYSERLRVVMGPHVVGLLRAGTSVVMGYPANTVAQRAWLLGLAQEAGVGHVLHYLDVSDEVCKARLRARNAAGDHPFMLSEAQFDRLAEHFVPPTDAEGLSLRVHDAGYSVSRKT